MKTKIRIKTAQGQAAGTNRKIKPFIIGFKKVKLDTYVNKKDDTIVWDIEGSYRDVMKIWKNVNTFASIIRGVLDSKMMKKTMRKKLSPEDEEILKKMLTEQTSIKVIKQAEVEEMDEFGKSWFQRIRESFVKKKEGD